MQQRSRVCCTCAVGVQRTSTDEISSKTQWCAKNLVPGGGEGPQPSGSHTPWFLPAQPKPMYESDQVTTYCDVPVCADQTVVRANRINTRFVDRGSKTVTLLEMS